MPTDTDAGPGPRRGAGIVGGGVAVAGRASVNRELAGLDALDIPPEQGPTLARRLWFATWPKLLALGFVLLLWQTVIWLEWYERFQLAPPDEVLPRMWRDVREGITSEALGITLQRMARGYAMALVGGLLLGAAVAQSKILRSALGSLVTGLQTMPSVAWFPLATLLFGVTDKAILAVVVLGAGPSIANGLISGVDNVAPLLTRAGRVLGARGVRLWRHVILPAALPNVLGGLKQGWAFAWRSLMAGELIVIIPGETSLGALLQNRRDLNDGDGLLAVMLVILLVGIVVDAMVFAKVERAVRRRWGLTGA
jgi:NitT/TauT family transport system permease protein